jgi:hypothetical protein
MENEIGAGQKQHRRRKTILTLAMASNENGQFHRI